MGFLQSDIPHEKEMRRYPGVLIGRLGIIADAWQENDEALARLKEATAILNQKAEALLSLSSLIEHEGEQINAFPSKLEDIVEKIRDAATLTFPDECKEAFHEINRISMRAFKEQVYLHAFNKQKRLLESFKHEADTRIAKLKANDKRTMLTDKIFITLLLLLVGLAMIVCLVIAYNWMILHSPTLWKMFAIIGSITFAGIIFCLWFLDDSV